MNELSKMIRKIEKNKFSKLREMRFEDAKQKSICFMRNNAYRMNINGGNVRVYLIYF